MITFITIWIISGVLTSIVINSVWDLLCEKDEFYTKIDKNYFLIGVIAAGWWTAVVVLFVYFKKKLIKK